MKDGRQRRTTTGRKLKEYRRKRDFRKTAEPAGDDRTSSRRGLQYVVQKHAATQLHYDLRLELDGVMKSWAVPKGPSLGPTVKRLAMQVEDHPIDYNTFEGTIPRGEYGGGTVMLWDRGTYTPDDVPAGTNADAAARRQLAAGKLAFSLDGDRLRGSFTLVRTGGGSKPKWLLIKHQDTHAETDSDVTAEVMTSVATGRTMDEIASDSDRIWHSNRPRTGRRTKRATPDRAEPLTLAPMRPAPADRLPTGDDWSYQPWHGGTRALAFATADTARLIDDQARDITRQHPAIAGELASVARRAGVPFVLDGEIATDHGPDDTRTLFFAWDLIAAADSALIDLPWALRHDALHALLRPRRSTLVRCQSIDTDGERAFRRVRRRRLPGLFARRADAPYKPGNRSDGLLRITTR